jgi:flagellar biosynthesis/type III secretory pathway chaperone
MVLKKLTDELSRQMGLLQELQGVLERESRELADMKLDAMSEINDLKEELSQRIKTHADMLRQTIGEVAEREGLPAAATLGAVTAALKNKGNHEIPRLHRDLNLVAERVRQLLAMNGEIAERFAVSVKSSLDLVTRIINQSNIYGSSGGYQQRPTGSVMINREA